MNYSFKALLSVFLVIMVITVLFPTRLNKLDAAPVLPFSRIGNTLIDGKNETGHLLSAWIDGVQYGNCITDSNSNNTNILVNGTDWNTSGNNFKSGGENGDNIIYLLETENGTLIANETDIFQSGGVQYSNWNFASMQNTENNFLKIYKVFANPISGHYRIDLKNIGNATINVNNNWMIKSDGTSVGNYESWSVRVPSTDIYRDGTVSVDLGSVRLNATYGDVELCWNDTTGIIAGGKPVVMDRVEWSAKINSHNCPCGNTTMPDKIGVIPYGYHLERKLNGKLDTDNCNVDFAIVPDSATAGLIVVVTDPAQGVSWIRGTLNIIDWIIYGSSNYIAFLNISSNGGSTYSPLYVQNPSIDTYSWSVPATQTPSMNYIIKVDVVDLSNLSMKGSNVSGIFSIGNGINISSVTIFPPSTVIMYVGTVQNFTALAYDAYGNLITTGATYAWTLTGGIGSITSITNKVTTFTAGTQSGIGWLNVTVTVNTEKSMNSTTIEITKTQPVLDRITITPSGHLTVSAYDKVYFYAEGFAGSGNIIGGVLFNWSISPKNTGVLSAIKGPNITFIANSNETGINGTLQVTGWYNKTTLDAAINITVRASPPQVDHILINPSSITIKINGTWKFAAYAYDKHNTEMKNISFTWSVAPSTLGYISKDGNFTAVTIGSGKIKASAFGKTGTSNITVSKYEPWRVGYLTIQPIGAENIGIGSSVQFTATAFANNNTPIPTNFLQYQWDFNLTKIGSLDPQNDKCVFTAIGEGSGVIRALVTCNGLVNAINVTVSVQAKAVGFSYTTSIIIIVVIIIVLIALYYLYLRSKNNKPDKNSNETRKTESDKKDEVTETEEKNDSKGKDDT